MIRTSPGSPAHHAMLLLAQTPGMTSDEIAAEVYPVHLAPPAYDVRNTAAVTRWREEFEAAEKASRAKGSRLVGRLQEKGLIETRGAPRLSEGFVQDVAEEAERLLVEWPHLLESLDGPAVLTPEEADRRAVLKVLRRRSAPREGLAWHVRIVEALRVEKPPGSARALFASLSNGGAANHAYKRLDQIGAIVPPSQRWLTAKGVALLEDRKEAA